MVAAAVGIGTAVAGVAGSAISSGASQSAAKAQEQAAEQANQVQQQIYQQNLSNMQPYLQAGNTGLNALQYYEGLGGSIPGSAAPTYLTADQIRAQLMPQFSGQASNGNPTAPDPSTLSAIDQAALRNSTSHTYEQDPTTGKWGYKLTSQTGGDDGGGSGTSWIYAGQPGAASGGGIDQAGLDAAVNAQLAQQSQQQQSATSNPLYGSLLTPYKAYTPFTQADLPADDGYQFRLDQGTDQLQHSAAAAGGLNSGRALKALSDYSQNSASQEYQNAYNRYNQDYTTGYNAYTGSQTNAYNKLAALAGIGQSSASALAGVGQNFANQTSSNLNAGANAEAAGTVGSANATNQGLGTVANSLTGYASAPPQSGFGTNGYQQVGAAFSPASNTLYSNSGQPWGATSNG